MKEREFTFSPTFSLPSPSSDLKVPILNTYCSLGAKWWLRGGVGGQFPRNLNWSQNLTGDFTHMEPFNILVLFTPNLRASWNFYFFQWFYHLPMRRALLRANVKTVMVFKTRRSSFRPYQRRKIWPRFLRANIWTVRRLNVVPCERTNFQPVEDSSGAVWM